MTDAVWMVEVWNRFVPLGAEVVVQLDDLSVRYTRTRSDAWVTDADMPVVKVEGIAGGYLLTRVRPR